MTFVRCWTNESDAMKTFPNDSREPASFRTTTMPDISLVAFVFLVYSNICWLNQFGTIAVISTLVRVASFALTCSAKMEIASWFQSSKIRLFPVSQCVPTILEVKMADLILICSKAEGWMANINRTGCRLYLEAVNEVFVNQSFDQGRFPRRKTRKRF